MRTTMNRLALLLALMTLPVLAHAASDVVADGVTYHWSDQDLGYIVTGWDGETPIQSLHICGTVDGVDVVAIQRGAFQDNTDILYVKIDEGITRIGESAFRGCKSLQYAVLPEGLVTICEEAFAFCSSLEIFSIPSTVRDIQARAFMGCTGVTDVYFNITDADALMAAPAETGAFVWWDGWYRVIPGDYQTNDSRGNTDKGREDRDS